MGGVKEGLSAQPAPFRRGVSLSRQSDTLSAATEAAEASTTTIATVLFARQLSVQLVTE